VADVAGTVTAVSAASVTLGDVAFACAWTVRGNPAQKAFIAEAETLFGLPLPLEPMTDARRGEHVVLWLGPRAWLYVTSSAPRQDDFDATRRALNAAGGALFDVSASYVAWAIAGAAAGRVLNRSCPLDFHPRAFPAGHCAQSMLGHINALVYRPDQQPRFIVMVARSLAADAWDNLCTGAAADGYRVVPPVPFPAAEFPPPARSSPA
jgi:sarcosine oxidase, subunit gamma